MNVKESEFDALEQPMLELAAEIEFLDLNENRLRERLSTETNRADAAESEEEMSRHAAAEAGADAAAANACAERISSALTSIRSDLVAVELQLGPAKRDCATLEKRCSDLSMQVNTKEQDLQQLRHSQMECEVRQQTYADLEEKVNHIINEVKGELVNLKDDLSRVEKSVVSGVELRERARLAAAAHAHERRLADTELKQTVQQLRQAKIEMGHLKIKLAEAQVHSNKQSKLDLLKSSLKKKSATVEELRSLLETERMGVTQLKRALDNAHAVNKNFRAQITTIDIQPDTDNTSSIITKNVMN